MSAIAEPTPKRRPADRLRAVSYFSLQSYCTRNPGTWRGKKQTASSLTCRGRKSLSSSVGDNCRLCVKIGSDWLIGSDWNRELVSALKADVWWDSRIWKLYLWKCWIIASRISQGFLVIVKGKSKPFISCVPLCQAPCLFLKRRRMKVPTSVSSPDWIPLGRKIQKHVHDSVAVKLDRQEGQEKE